MRYWFIFSFGLISNLLCRCFRFGELFSCFLCDVECRGDSVFGIWQCKKYFLYISRNFAQQQYGFGK